MLDRTNKILLIVLLVLILWASVITWRAEAQYCYLWHHYRWEWYKGRQVRINYPVWCCGYTCRPACRTLYGGWGPCR